MVDKNTVEVWLEKAFDCSSGAKSLTFSANSRLGQLLGYHPFSHIMKSEILARLGLTGMFFAKAFFHL